MHSQLLFLYVRYTLAIASIFNVFTATKYKVTIIPMNCIVIILLYSHPHTHSIHSRLAEVLRIEWL